MKISELKPFDAAEVLTDDESIRHYLALAFEDGDPRMIQKALGTVARARGLPQVARDAGLSIEELRSSLNGNDGRDFAAFVTLVRALGFKLLLEPARE